jgi:hypothetical protein
MNRLQRWKLYFRGPKEPELNFTQAELAWWESIASPIRSRTFVQSFAAVFIGMLAGQLIMEIIGRATGTTDPRRLHVFSFFFTGFMGLFATMVGWHTLLKVSQQQMIKSRRLRAAMKLDQPDFDEPRRLTPRDR